MKNTKIIIYIFGGLFLVAATGFEAAAQQDPRLPRHLRSPNLGIQRSPVGGPDGSRFLKHNSGRGLRSIRTPKGQGQMRSGQGTIRPGGGALGPNRAGGGAAGLQSMRSRSAQPQGAASGGLRSIRSPSSAGASSLQDKRGMRGSGASGIRRSVQREQRSQNFLSQISSSLRNFFGGNNKGKP